MTSVSLVVPIYNEVENIPLLYRQLTEALAALHRDFEILFVDDGSRDGSTAALRLLAAQDQRVRVVCFRRNFGQTAAMHAGLQMAHGDVIVTLDGDLQNDPADIGMMLAKIDEGYDLVHGWRKDRKDAFLNRRLPSLIANWLIAKTTRFPIHDLGCTLKAIRREIAVELELYGEMHRFIPILAHARGARCAEVVTNHRPRQFGQTKYGLSRTFRVILDLITVKFLLDWFASPMKCFGGLGLGCLALALLCALTAVLMKLAGGVDLTANPLTWLTALTTIISGQFFGLGLLGEVNARIYFGSQSKQPYTVRELINFNTDAPSDHKPLRARAA
jgi:glycosyltransferase involved in cell wall biosynthesis